MRTYVPAPYQFQTPYPTNIQHLNALPIQPIAQPMFGHSYRAEPYHNKPARQQMMPPVNTVPLVSSSFLTLELLADAQMISQTLNQANSFNTELMEAAQLSNHSKVSQLINAIPIKHRTEISFTPGVIIITVLPIDTTNSCCRVELTMNWQNFA